MYLTEQSLHGGVDSGRREHAVGHVDEGHVDGRSAIVVTTLLDAAVVEAVGFADATASGHAVNGMAQPFLRHGDHKLKTRVTLAAHRCLAPHAPQGVAQCAARLAVGEEAVHRHPKLRFLRDATADFQQVAFLVLRLLYLALRYL